MRNKSCSGSPCVIKVGFLERWRFNEDAIYGLRGLSRQHVKLFTLNIVLPMCYVSVVTDHFILFLQQGPQP